MSYDDPYANTNDYDDIDDEYPDPGAPGGYVGDAETLLRRAIDIVATAPTMPLSSSPRIDRDEIIELLEESLHRLPDELRQARWMLKERQEFVAKTRREADELLEAARVRAERMVQRTEVVRAAEQRARQVMETAEADSRRLKHETEDFLDQRLGSFEILLDKLSEDGARRPPAPVDRWDPRRHHQHRRRRPDDGLLRPGRLRAPGRRPGALEAAGILARWSTSPASCISTPSSCCVNPAAIREFEFAMIPGALVSVVHAALDGDDRPATRTRSAERRHHGAAARSARRGPACVAAVSRRCRASTRPLIDELYQKIVIDPDAFLIEDGQLDLLPLVRETALLAARRRAALPAGLRRAVPDSAGSTATRSRATAASRSATQRWAALDGLELDRLSLRPMTWRR